MSKYLIVLFFFLSVISKGLSQSSMSDYSFVIVPERFNFLNEVDKYQLNSIAEFLFNKHGFHAFKSNNVPNTRPCDGLYADVVNIRALLRTKLVLILRDCNGFEVYRSPEGVTRLKEFKQAHQDALRKAFAYFDEMGVKQKEIVYFEDELASSAAQNPVQGNDTMIADGVISLNLPKARFSSYDNEDGTYMLRKTTAGYSLFKETATMEDGLMLLGKIDVADDTAKLLFIDTDNTLYDATFDAAENLVIQKEGNSKTYRRVR